MEKEQLRKADLGTSLIIVLFGLWVISEAFKMPMKDSWGGVQNVWYVSPAIFPLCVGVAISLLGLFLFQIALRAVGVSQAIELLKGLGRRAAGGGAINEPTFRFLAIVVLFVSFVFLYIPRVDFFLGSLLFLVVFISMFHVESADCFGRFFLFFLGGAGLTLAFFVTGLNEALSSETISFPADLLTMGFIGTYVIYAKKLTAKDSLLGKQLRTGLIVAFIAPFILGPIFKYFLLVPLPFEGMVVELLDTFWYADFWG